MDTGQFHHWVSVRRKEQRHGLEPTLLVWSSRDQCYRKVEEEHLVYNENLNEVRIVLDEIHGE